MTIATSARFREVGVARCCPGENAVSTNLASSDCPKEMARCTCRCLTSSWKAQGSGADSTQAFRRPFALHQRRLRMIKFVAVDLAFSWVVLLLYFSTTSFTPLAVAGNSGPCSQPRHFFFAGFSGGIAGDSRRRDRLRTRLRAWQRGLRIGAYLDSPHSVSPCKTLPSVDVVFMDVYCVSVIWTDKQT